MPVRRGPDAANARPPTWPTAAPNRPMTREAYIHQDGHFLRGKLWRTRPGWGTDIRNLRAWPLAGPKHGPRHGHHHLGPSHSLSVTGAGTVEGKPFHSA